MTPQRMTTFDDIYEELEKLENYAQWLAPSHDMIRASKSRQCVAHLRAALSIIQEADPYGEKSDHD